MTRVVKMAALEMKTTTFVYMENNKCIRDIVQQGWSCRMCCRDANCGMVPTCQHMPDDDICPPAYKGCPYDNVETHFIGPKSSNRCYSHNRCDTILNGNGQAHQSGIQCKKGIRMRKGAIFCFRPETDPTYGISVSQARSRGCTLPLCDQLRP